MRPTSSFAGASLCALLGVAAPSWAAEPSASPKKPVASAQAKPPVKPAAKKPNPNVLREIDWRELLPANERQKYSPNAPSPVHGPLGEGGPPAQQTITTSVNTDLNQAKVKLPGFVVPIGEPQNGVFREFYLVPYIGEDIHVPPPPSNQMVYVQSATGIEADAVHEAYWVTGKMRVETRSTPLGTSAYSVAAEQVEQYQY